jgi:hypothetical protein
MKVSGRGVVVGFAVVVVVAAVAIALLVIDGPGERRAVRLDARRVADLRQIARSVDLFWTRTGELPASLDQAREGQGGPDVPTDPETSEPYAFRAFDGSSYELCTEFNRESTLNQRRDADPFWSHAQGRQCFQLEAEEVDR